MLRRVVAAIGVVLGFGVMASAASALPPEVFSGVGGNNTSVTPGTANAAMSAFEAPGSLL